LPAFVGGTIRNIIRAHFRGEQRIDRLKSFQSTGDEGDPESDCGRGELLELARISLARLEPRDQEILRLWLVEDLSLSEIADRVGIRPAAARQRKLRALRRARKSLDDLSQTPKQGHY
jgi:RNA polymerase sigma-70 factor (ECF subfamily)